MKRMRSDERKRIQNQAWLSELKTLSKRLTTLRAEPEKAKEVCLHFMSRLDKAATKGVIPKGRADRKKSRIALFLASLESKPAKKKRARKKAAPKS